MKTERMDILEAVENDIEDIIAIESHKDNRDFLWVGTQEEHLAEISDPKHRLWVFRSRRTGDIVGYALARLDRKSDVFELRRIAITQKGQGYGREAMEALFDFAFGDWGANRFWLDAYPDNLTGIRLYESLGMHRDGVLRQNYKSDRGFLDQIIFSLLRSEYLERRP